MLSIFEVVAILLTLTAAFGLLNRLLLGLPDTIGLLVMGLAASLVLAIAEAIVPSFDLKREMSRYLAQLDLRDALLNGMLAFLLFAGAINVDLSHLRNRAWDVMALAVFATAMTTLLVGAGLWLFAQVAGSQLPLSWCFAFGALISPTDPVAVLSTLSRFKLPEDLKLLLTGESLFNDGVGIVLFITFAEIAAGTGNPGLLEVAARFWFEAIGGAFLGLATGYGAYRATRRVDNYALEIMISLALVTGTYAIAQRIGVSGPIAIVVGGILLGNRGPADAMSKETRRYFFGFWTLVDQILNAMLFLVIGLQVIVMNFEPSLLWGALVAIPLVLCARLVSVSLPVLAFAGRRDYGAGAIPILTWGGLHGGISIALALSLPPGDAKPLLLAATYGAVLFSLIVQGLSLPRLIRHFTSQP